MIALLLLAVLPTFSLPDSVVPLKHSIEMTIDPAKESFTGVARIEATVRSPQSTLWLNGRDLNVTEAWLEVAGTRLETKAETAGGEFIGLTVAKPVGPGNVTIGIRYSAPLSDKAVAGPNRKKTGDDWYVFTTFTPTDARRAFPCFDEPRFKTTWEMSLRIPREQRAFGNAPMVKETEEPGGMKLVSFAPTEIMPAEVVAYAVGPFDVWDAGKAGAKQTPVRVITARGQAEQGKQAGIATQEILPRLEKYTGIPYPWEKLDHIALPQGAFGAVENPGLITYQSRGLLILPAEASEDRRRPMRSLQAHEIGHQWFGNLVTQADWTDVWLSEGFATWISAKMMDEEQPADRKRLGVVAAREQIMAADSGSNTHPVRREMHNRDELKTVYDRFPYQKGAAILVMLESWLGEGPFQQGIRQYLKSHQMGNATTRDLEAALPPQATPVMDGMLNSTGVPIVKTSCESKKLKIERQGPGPFPVCWKTATASACSVLNQTIEVDSCDAWVFPNANATGYYRTVWSAEQLQALAGALDKLTGAERLTLVYDLRAQKSSDPILKKLAEDPQPEVARAAKAVLGVNEPRP